VAEHGPGRRRGAVGWAGAWSAWVLIWALSACSPIAAPPTASPSAPAAIDFTAPGRAVWALDELIQAAGSARAIKVELDATSASLSVVIGQQAETWAWRDGVVQAVESDTAYVGQTIFDPRRFDLTDLGRLFRQAEVWAESAKSQRLHIVEYADGQVYMTVTTTPESAPVFFRSDGTLVRQLDLTTAAGLAVGLADAVAGRSDVLAIGLDPASGGVWADRLGRPGQVVRTLRMPRLPARQIEREETVDGPTFDPAWVRPQAIASVIASLERLTGHSPTDGLSWVIGPVDQDGPPLMVFSLGGQEVRASLDGTILSD
jgi:hypothetical protein